MSACSHRLRLKVRHGGLQLWLIGMRLEGTEGDTHTHTLFPQKHKQHIIHRTVPRVRHTHTQHYEVH